MNPDLIYTCSEGAALSSATAHKTMADAVAHAKRQVASNIATIILQPVKRIAPKVDFLEEELGK